MRSIEAKKAKKNFRKIRISRIRISGSPSMALKLGPYSQRRRRRSGIPDPGNPDFPEIFFSLFFASMDLLGPQGHPRMFRYHLIRIRIWIREIRFFEIRTFCFFDFLSLKTLQYGCLMTPLDQPKSLVPVQRCIMVLNGTFLIHFRST